MMKRFANWIFFIVCLCLLLPSCTNEEISMSVPEAGRAGAGGEVTGSEGMIQDPTTGWWITKKRVPLVGDGRLINTLTGSLISVIGESGGSCLDYIIDKDITNAASLNSELLGVQAVMNTITSVKDVYHTYAPGQTAGFVIKSSSPGLLKLDVINGFWIGLYKDGERVQLKGATSGSGGSLLGLNLLSPSNEDGLLAISVEAESAFDEVRIGVYGVKANVLNTLQIMYAYVGDNPIIPVTKGGDSRFSDASVYDKSSWTYNFWNTDYLVDDEPDNYTTKTPGIVLDFGGAVTVCCGDSPEFKPGMEVGYVMGGFDPVSVSLGNTVLTVYAPDPNKEDEVATMTTGGLVGVTALGTQSSTLSVIIPENAKDGQYVYLKIPGGIKVLDIVRIYYAYIREAVKIDITSLFSVGNDETSNDFYQFHVPDASVGTVEYEIISEPQGASPTLSTETTGRLNNMTVEGDYKVKMTFIATDGNSYSQIVTIHRNKVLSADTACDQLFYSDDDYGTTLGSSDGAEGCVLCVGNWEGENAKLIDRDKQSYVSVINPLTFIGSKALAEIVFSKTDFTTTEKTRIGFALQVSKELLNVDVLNLFSIACKDKNGKTIAEAHGVADGNNGISVGLIGGSSGKVRFSIEVPANIAIHSIELRLNELLTVKLSSLRLYYVFHEPAEGSCSTGASVELGDACLEMVTPASYGAHFNYDAMGGHLANVGGGFNDLTNFIDSKKETYASFGSVVNAGAQMLAVKFDEMKPFQTIGVLLGNDTHLIDVDLLDEFSMALYYKGELVEDMDDFGVLGLQLLGYGGDVMIEATPTTKYDEVRITIGGVLVAESTKLYGLFTRRDDDGNGIPDCSEDNDDETGTLKLYSITQHVCATEENPNEGTVKCVITGGKDGDKIQFRCFKSEESSSKAIDSELSGSSVSFQLPVGDWYITAYLVNSNESSNSSGMSVEIEDFSSVHVMVHPIRTTWTGGNEENHNTDWLRWDNWKEGIPWTCTDVLVPSGLDYYPVLKKEPDSEPEFWGECNYCNRIQFEPGAEVVNTHYLHYESAWVNVALKAGEYNMFAAPLKEMYTGDMFYIGDDQLKKNQITGYATCWLDYVEKDYEVNRFIPKVYQRMWNRSVQNAVNDKNGYVAVDLDDDSWTAPFNLVSQLYEAGQGILVRPGKEGDTGSADTGDGTTGTGSTTTDGTLVFRFPKRYDTYQYYDLETTEAMSNRWETLTRNAADVGRFIYENASGSITFPYHVLLENKRPGDVFLAGNPFMAHINVEKFFELNPAVQEIRFLKKNGGTYSYEKWNKKDTDADVDKRQIAPMQSFLVVVADAYKDMYRYQLNIHYVEEMLEMKKQ